MRAMRVALIVIAVVFAILLGLIGYVSLRADVETSGLRRSVTPRVLLGGGETEVTLSKLARPAVNCPAARRASRVVLVIDRSGSMAENDALVEAQAAARSFVNTVDLDATQVAVLYFSDQVQLTQSFSQDIDQLVDATSTPIQPDGGTDIAQALGAAGELLRGDAADNATSVILILTDGGSDPAAAEQVARQLRNEEVRIIAIALLTIDSNPGLLQDLVSAPSDYHESTSAAELADIYADAALQLNQAVAFDMTLVESVAPGLTVQPDSVRPAAQLATNVITWTVPSLAAGQVDFAYSADITGFGLKTINSAETTMTYTDCIAGAVATALAPGPQVLVLPPWLLALLGLLLLFPIGLAWFRRPKVGPTPAGLPDELPRPNEPPPDRVPAWLRRLDDGRKTLVAGDAGLLPDDELTPTIIIGLGPVGRIVLSQIAQALRTRYGGQLPAEVRLMQIDVHPQGVGGDRPTLPDYLLPEEWVLLEPNLTEVSANIQRRPDVWQHLDWYEPTATEDYARTAGRMALFYDLKDGADRSIVWRGLTRLSTRLEHPKLRLVGSTFDDVGSGLLVDMAWLMQLNAHSTVDVELWLSGPVNSDWPARVNQPYQSIRRDEQHTRSLAVLRELERFERNQAAPFQYVSSDHLQSQFRSNSTGAVIQTLFVFTPPTTDTSLDDHLATMADALLATLHTTVQQQFARHLTRTAAMTNVLVNDRSKGMVSSLGAYSVRLPLGWLEECLTWRAMYETLFEQRIGLLPLVTLNAEGGYEPFDPDDVPDNAVARRESAEAFVDRFRDYYDTDEFFYALVRLTSDRLNGEQGELPPLSRTGALGRTQRWLVMVRNLLNQQGATTAAGHANDLHRQLGEWEEFLEQQVRPIVERRFQTAHEQLAILARQTGRHWALGANLDWPFYKQRVRDWLDVPTAGLSDPLLRGAQRLGWFVGHQAAGRRLSVQLWAPSGEFVWSEDADVDPLTFALPRQPQVLAERLYTLLSPLALGRANWTQTLELAGNVPPEEWLDRAAPRLAVDGTSASQELGIAGSVGETFLLVAPESAGAQTLQKSLGKTSKQPTIELCETKDASTITVIRLRDRVPLHTCSGLYDEAAWREHLPPPGFYTRRGEQRAAATESNGRLSAAFVGWLEQDPQLIDLYARAYLFGLLDVDETGQFELPGLGAWPGRAPGLALANLFSDTPSRQPQGLSDLPARAAALSQLKAAAENAQDELWRNPGKREYLRLAVPRLVVPLTNSSHLPDKDLAVYLQGIIRQL